ncbi:MAG: NAD(P)/FAD-dependent oxidoreductase [Rhizobiaceae bacterium]
MTKLPEKTDVVVVGAGQAGIAMSEHLRDCGIFHVVLERGRIAERWRSRRWDSLVANGPAWHDRFPGMEFEEFEPDEFVPKEKVADYFVAYSRMIEAPVFCNVSVDRVTRLSGRDGFHVQTSSGSLEARFVVAATGPFHSPLMPQLVPGDANVHQMHSADYKNPGQLGEGGVLVVGAGSSGVQIADELQRSGRNVYLSIGPHDRLPRRYRNRDYVWWMGVLGMWDDESVPPGKEHVSIAVSGAYGGRTIDFRELAANGITLVGRTAGYKDGTMRFDRDVQTNFENGDTYYLSFLDQCDAHVDSNGLELPQEPSARQLGGTPDCVTKPVLELDLAGAGISTIIWATGYTPDFSWLDADVFKADGKPRHVRGVAPLPGVYFLGLPFMMSRGSSFIYGVWHDAKHIADHIFIQQKYSAYTGDARRVTNDA